MPKHSSSKPSSSKHATNSGSSSSSGPSKVSALAICPSSDISNGTCSSLSQLSFILHNSRSQVQTVFGFVTFSKKRDAKGWNLQRELFDTTVDSAAPVNGYPTVNKDVCDYLIEAYVNSGPKAGEINAQLQAQGSSLYQTQQEPHRIENHILASRAALGSVVRSASTVNKKGQSEYDPKKAWKIMQEYDKKLKEVEGRLWKEEMDKVAAAMAAAQVDPEQESTQTPSWS